MQTFTHCLFTLAAHPEWTQPLREEIERVVAEEGMTKSAIQKMFKLDSFLREDSRMSGMAGGLFTSLPHLRAYVITSFS
jgi:hypothetical protein